MPDIKYLTIQLPKKITWEQGTGSKVKLKLRNNNDRYKTITNYESSIYTNENPNTNMFCNITLDHLKQNGKVYIENTEAILEILDDDFYTNYMKSMELLYISKKDILTPNQVVKLINDNSYIKTLKKEKELDYQIAIDNQMNVNTTRLIGELESQFLQLGIRTIIHDETYSKIAKLILDTNKLDILKVLAKNTYSVSIHYELKPVFGKYHNNSIHPDYYNELEVAKILIDFNLPVTKINIKEIKQHLNSTMQKISLNPGIQSNNIKLYITAKVDPTMVIDEIKNMKDLRSHKNIIFYEPHLYMVYGDTLSELSSYYIDEAESCDFISQKDICILDQPSWLNTPLFTTKISFQETK